MEINNNITLDEAIVIRKRLEAAYQEAEFSDYYDSRKIDEIKKDIAFIAEYIEKLEVKND